MRLLAACRTAALGGQGRRCEHCGDVRYHYHSCGDRHCPQCGGSKRARWLAARQAELRDVPYFHLVFTLPHELSALVLGNRRRLYGLLLAASAQTLLHLGADPKHLGARLGAMAVLHTWGQQLEHHPHVHMIVPGGGLACDRNGVVTEPWQWRSSRPNFLLPVKVLGRVFRGKYLEGLRQAYDRGELQCGGGTADLADPRAWHKLVDRLYGKDWVVYAKKPFAGPTALLKYLTRYTHRVALDNGRLVKLGDERVTLTYKDYAAGCVRKELTLAAVELLRRFAMHIVPGFVRIRHYGLLTHRGRGQRLAQCRALVAARPGVAVGAAGASVAPVSAAPVSAAPVAPAAGQWSLPAPAPAPVSVPLLMAALTVAATAGPRPATPPAVLTVTTPATPTTVSEPGPPVTDDLCRVCRQGKLVTIWHAARPKGRDVERAWRWDTS